MEYFFDFGRRVKHEKYLTTCDFGDEKYLITFQRLFHTFAASLDTTYLHIYTTTANYND